MSIYVFFNMNIMMQMCTNGHYLHVLDIFNILLNNSTHMLLHLLYTTKGISFIVCTPVCRQTDN